MNDFTRKMGANPIENGRCAARPFGCGAPVNPATDFTDVLSQKEYQISGLCQACQDRFFTDPDERDIDDAEDWERNQLASDGND